MLVKWDDNSNRIDTIIAALLAIWGVEFIFLVCEPGEWMTKQFETFSQGLEQCNWYKLSIELQQMYLIFLADAQQEKQVKAYGDIVCSRETFKKVMKEMTKQNLCIFFNILF